MTLQALLVSRDEDAVPVLQGVTHELDVETEVCAELQPAVERLAQGATSLLVVDYDVEHAAELLKVVRHNYAGSCVALAMVKGLASIQAAYDMGANFVLIKPVTPDAASRSLSEATALVQRMVHRPARTVVPTLAYVSFEGVQDPAIILDISEGGMAIQALQPVQASGPLRLHFDLPGLLDNMNLAAEIMWADSCGRAGLRFRDLSEDDLQRIRGWVRMNGSKRQPPAKGEERAPFLAPVAHPIPQGELRPGSASVPQRVFSTLVDAGIVLLASLVFFATFLVWARHLPVSRWTLPIAVVTPFLFWVCYLYLFLAHPRGTVGMQMAERGTAVADRPEMFDLVPPSPLVAASSRVLRWMEARGAEARRTEATPDAMAAPVSPGAGAPAHPRDGLSHS
jgi:CheY-like chemotaxis protein